jgi:uncharacterized protein YoxC
MLASVQTPSALPDTVNFAMQPSALATAESVATIVLTVAVLGVLVGLVGVLLQMRKLTRSLGEAAQRVQHDAGPVLDRARSVAENVEFITAAVRTDVQKLNDSVARLNDRLKQASDRMEERIQDFTALVEVLQTEAEDLALDTAAAVRGVRAGTRSLGASSDPMPEQEPDERPLLSSEGRR